VMWSMSRSWEGEGMHAIRAAHAFDGTRFWPGGATVLVDGDRIVGVHNGRVDLPGGVEVSEYDGTVLPGLFDCRRSSTGGSQLLIFVPGRASVMACRRRRCRGIGPTG
jgi:hypothetical protein